MLAKPPPALRYQLPNIKPSQWSTLESNLSQVLTYDKNSSYRTSAVISSLAETATLPLRLKGSREDITMTADHLNWQKRSRLGQLGGIISPPFTATEATFIDLCCSFSTSLSKAKCNSRVKYWIKTWQHAFDGATCHHYRNPWSPSM